MECPRCKKTLVDSSERCNSCGFFYPDDIWTKLSVHLDLRKEVENLRSTLETNVLPGIKRISGKINLLEKALADDLQMLTVSQEKIEPEEKLHVTISEPLEEISAERERKAGTHTLQAQDQAFH